MKNVNHRGENPTTASGSGIALRRRLRLPRIPRPPLMVGVLAGAFLGMYFQPTPLRLIFDYTGLEPGGGTSSPFAVAPTDAVEQSTVGN